MVPFAFPFNNLRQKYIIFSNILNFCQNGFREAYIYRSFDGITYTFMMNGNGTFTQ